MIRVMLSHLGGILTPYDHRFVEFYGEVDIGDKRCRVIVFGLHFESAIHGLHFDVFVVENIDAFFAGDTPRDKII